MTIDTYIIFQRDLFSGEVFPMDFAPTRYQAEEKVSMYENKQSMYGYTFHFTPNTLTV